MDYLARHAAATTESDGHVYYVFSPTFVPVRLCSRVDDTNRWNAAPCSTDRAADRTGQLDHTGTHHVATRRRTAGIDHTRRTLLKAIPLAGIAALGGGPAAAEAGGQTFPAVLPLPTGFQPEGIVSGRGTEFFVGSLAGGAIYKGDLRTGEGEILAPPVEGGVAVGLSYDPRSDYLFVAGGTTGQGFVCDATTVSSYARSAGVPAGTFRATEDSRSILALCIRVTLLSVACGQRSSFTYAVSRRRAMPSEIYSVSRRASSALFAEGR